jgi:hypothetical protein
LAIQAGKISRLTTKQSGLSHYLLEISKKHRMSEGEGIGSKRKKRLLQFERFKILGEF